MTDIQDVDPGLKERRPRKLSAISKCLALIQSVLAVLLLACGPCVAAELGIAKNYSLPGTLVDNIHSTHVGADYLLYISLPREYEKQSGPYPVLLLLDADYTFALYQSIAWFLADEGELQPIILVGIAYPGVSQEKHGPLFKLNRTRDYTPTHVAQGGYGSEFQKFSGGADRFLDFIEQELVPHLQKNFRVKPTDRTLVGYSYGGLLASYSLLTRPGLFQRFIIVSPSLWYDNHMMLALEDKTIRIRNDLPVRAFFSVGGNETASHGQKDMVKDLERFVATLNARKYQDFRSHLWIAPDETHHSVFACAAMRGIRWVFAAEPILSAGAKSSAVRTSRHYRK